MSFSGKELDLEIKLILVLNYIFTASMACDYSRSSDCFSLGWPMRDDGEFFKSARETVPVGVSANTLK